MEYEVNGQRLAYLAEGPEVWGDDVVLLDKAVDLTTQTPWHESGYTIESLFDDVAVFDTFRHEVSKKIIDCWRSSGLMIPDNFELTRYHTVALEMRQHLAAVDKTKLIQVEDFPLGIEKIEHRISRICNTPLIARNPFDGQRVFHFRVIRPLQKDNNPLHRDVWLEDYDNCINLYIPLAGSNAKSSLILLKGSHLWSELRVKRTAEGATINGLKFNVPAVTEVAGPYKALRPDPGRNQVLVFSPYLIHGGAINLNPDDTRISIELRLWKK